MLRPLSSLPLSKEALTEFTKDGHFYVEDIIHVPLNDSLEKREGRELIDRYLQPTFTLSALEHWQAELQYERISTCSESLDSFLGGGFQCGIITELCGAPESGKTQICLQACISVQLENSYGGLNGRAVFIDSRNGFSGQRIRDLIAGCHRRYPGVNFHPEKMMDNVTVLSPRTENEFLSTIDRLESLFDVSDDQLQIRLVVIDSLTFLLTFVDNASERTVAYITILKRLQKIASFYNASIIVTSELSTQIDCNYEVGFGSAGGQPVASRCQKRLMIARIRGSKFAGRLLKSATSPQIAVPFYITQDGIQDKI